MKKELRFSIECGELTCASRPGNFCKYLGSKNFGARLVCSLFPEEWRGSLDSSHTTLNELPSGPRKGWIGRCKACLEQDKKEEQCALSVK